MKYPENIREIEFLKPDYLGFIFFKNSKRFVGEINVDSVRQIDPSIKKVGVFVNEEEEEIKKICDRFEINHVQLHGEELPELCASLKGNGFNIIKVFSVGEKFDFSITENYKEVTDYFLFDTKSESYGGTGKKFNWKLFEEYDNKKPLFLSGGIGPGDVEEIKQLSDLNIHALDINSCFESEPGRKDVGLVKEFIQRIRH